MGNFKITKREILFSIMIIVALIIIGILISGSIKDREMEKHQEYNTALQINQDSELFTYGMETNIGNAFVYGDLIAVDTVAFPELKGEYSYVKQEKEEYTKHTRIVTYTDSDGKTKTKKENYWTWDTVNTIKKHCNLISFLGIEFDYNKVKLPQAKHIQTSYETSHIRYKYYGCSTKYVGTLYCRLGNETIENAEFYNNYSIEETLEHLKNSVGLIIFWVFWILFICGCVFGFYYLNNKWLEDN